jgi:hypothetical protein
VIVALGRVAGFSASILWLGMSITVPLACIPAAAMCQNQGTSTSKIEISHSALGTPEVYDYRITSLAWDITTILPSPPPTSSPKSLPRVAPSSSSASSPQSIVRRLVVVVVYRLILSQSIPHILYANHTYLIRTSTRRPIQVVPQVDIHLLSRTNIPRTLVRPVHTRNTPL